ncbi:MAG TPA: sigma-70 family RNA polymerase sigma factor [Anaerolineales bacterium]
MNRPPSNERDLLELARQHDEAAFASLVERYTPPLFRVVRRMVTDPMEVESILQETFWRFWQALPRYSSDRPLLPYLATIASNLARDRYRRERRLEDVSVEDILEGHADESAPDPGQVLDDQQSLQRLAAAVRDLPFAYRAVVSLRYEANMSYEEIAAARSLPLNTVRTHLRRAKDLLRRRLEEAEDG